MTLLLLTASCHRSRALTGDGNRGHALCVTVSHPSNPRTVP
jgi:hypothetical protein